MRIRRVVFGKEKRDGRGRGSGGEGRLAGGKRAAGEIGRIDRVRAGARDRALDGEAFREVARAAEAEDDAGVVAGVALGYAARRRTDRDGCDAGGADDERDRKAARQRLPRNRRSAARSAGGIAATRFRAASASPPCQRIASSGPRARPS